ncbi:MAG: FAD binding domain-containing protein [Oceanibaculum nanhaiense]|uniref:FAD binding domain-containing protein n=1 Tax=Oceanibaculum nanhaiense TaxID=1909734 RepID=UPI0025A339E1|nr:FAD binding domain-containing protein [Oceanibaculum nanhaiense]MDM7946641.1 FAD binding domain-containing protein [Oceanibaculum nanhaiense]
MKPARFDYLSAADIAGTVSLLAEGAKPMAGNQSLGPMLNLRLARPGHLADIALLPELRAVEETPDAVLLGAAITHAEIEDGEVPDPTGGWLRAAAANIAHRAVRNRGTIGGSLAHADPAADWPIVLTGLGAAVRLQGPAGTREMPVADFLTGPFSTALRPDELLTAVILPRPSKGARWGYWKFCRQVGEFAKASAAVLIDPNGLGLRCAVGALGRQPLLLDDPAALIEGQVSPVEALAKALPDRAPSELTLHATALTRALMQAKGEE